MRKITKITLLSVLLILMYGFLIKAYSKKPELTTNDDITTYDVIIVPGVPFNDDYWTDVLLSRIYWSHYLYKTGITKNIIYSGSAVYTPYIESEIMAMYGKEMGINESNIYTETNAEHSVENVYYSYHLALALGFEKIALATDPFQSRMMKWPSKRMKVDIDFIPFSVEIFDSIKTKNLDKIEIDPSKAFVNNFVSIENRENFFQRLMGTLGRNIEYID